MLCVFTLLFGDRYCGEYFRCVRAILVHVRVGPWQFSKLVQGVVCRRGHLVVPP